MNDNGRPSDIPENVWDKAYDFLSETKTSSPIEGLDFLIVQEAMARAMMSNWKPCNATFPMSRVWIVEGGANGLP